MRWLGACAMWVSVVFVIGVIGGSPAWSQQADADSETAQTIGKG